MRKTVLLYIIMLLLIIVSEKVFIFVCSFLFGYGIGYYSFNLLRPKRPKDEIIDFFLSYKNNVIECGILNRKT